MKKTALPLAVMVAAATATVGLAVASEAQAAPACPTPTVSISPSRNVAPNQLVEVTGHNWGCNAKFAFVYVTSTYSGEPKSQLGNGPRVPVASDGSFSYDVKTVGPVGARWTVTATSGDSSVTKTASITLAGSGSANTDPTAVPAGHVDTTTGAGGTSTDWGIAALGGAGIALIGGGLTAGRRRQAGPLHRSQG